MTKKVGESANKSKSEQGASDIIYTVILVVMSLVVGPFLYYSVHGYFWGMENAPEGYEYPSIYKVKTAVISAVLFNLFKRVFFALFEAKVYTLCK